MTKRIYMVIDNVFHGFWHYHSNANFKKAEKLLEELNDYLADRVYTTDLQLDIIRLIFFQEVGCVQGLVLIRSIR